MRHWALLLLLSLVMANSSPQTAPPSTQQLTDQIRLQQLQNDADLARMQSELERWRLEQERRRAAIAHEQQAQLLREQLAQSEADAANAAKKGKELADAAKKAEEAADEMREELYLAGVKSANAAYLAAAIGLPALLGFFIAKKANKEGAMRCEQKFGTVMMVCAFLLALLAFTISDGWTARLDALQNVMGTLRIQLFPEPDNYAKRLIDFPTKYLLTALAAVFAYGFTTYLDITPAWKRTRNAVPPTDAANES